MSKKCRLEEKQHWAGEESKLDNVQKLRGIYFIDSEDKAFNETLTHARKKLELHMDSAVPRKLRKTSGNSSLKGPKDPQEGTFEMSTSKERFVAKTTRTKRFSHENARLTNRQESAYQRLETKILKITLPKKGYTSMRHNNLVGKPILMPRQ